jgi:hypothetical protein
MPYFTFTLTYIFENKVAGGKMQSDGQFALCLAAVECPAIYFLLKDYQV